MASGHSASVVPRRPTASADQTRGGKTIHPRGITAAWGPRSSHASAASIEPVSTTCIQNLRRPATGASRVQASRRGTTSSTPLASAAHELSQYTPSLPGAPPWVKTIVARLAEAVRAGAATANAVSASMSLSRDRRGSKPARRSTSAPPAATSALPADRRIVAHGGSLAPARRATIIPAKTAGQRRTPQRSRPASATPVVGSTGDTPPATAAHRRPRSAVSAWPNVSATAATAVRRSNPIACACWRCMVAAGEPASRTTRVRLAGSPEGIAARRKCQEKVLSGVVRSAAAANF